MKCLPLPGEKLNSVLICVVSLMVPLFRSSEHIKIFVRFSVSKYIDLSNTLYGLRYIMPLACLRMLRYLLLSLLSNGGGILSPGVKRPEREGDHLTPATAEAKNTWNYTSTSRIRLHGAVLN